MSRLVRNPRALELQGRRAGIASRAAASGIDVGIAFLIYLVIFAALSFVWDLFFSDSVKIDSPSNWISGSGAWLVLVIYLWLGWASTGRTLGKEVMGLRVVRADATPLRGLQAFGRALLCATVYPVLLLALFNRQNKGLEDVVCRSVVVYDWIPESSRPRRLAPTGSGEQGA